MSCSLQTRGRFFIRHKKKIAWGSAWGTWLGIALLYLFPPAGLSFLALLFCITCSLLLGATVGAFIATLYSCILDCCTKKPVVPNREHTLSIVLPDVPKPVLQSSKDKTATLDIKIEATKNSPPIQWIHSNLRSPPTQSDEKKASGKNYSFRA